MSTTAVIPNIPVTTYVPRAVAFRIASVLIAVAFVFLFGAWRAVLAPWFVLPDTADHGWQRTNEIHVVADAAGGVLMLGVGISALLLVIRPLGRSTLVAWTAWTLVVIGLGMAVSTVLQRSGGMAEGALTAFVFMTLFVVPLVLLHPQRRVIPFGGAARTGAGPTRLLATVFAAVGTAALSGAAAVVWWRMSGGLFENPAEDDAVSLAMLCISLAIGCVFCVLGREGWRVLAGLIAGMVIFCLVAGLTIALW